MVGKVLPYVLIATLDFVFVVSLGLGLFSVPLCESFLQLVAASS
jgi:hypothetical protein